jgi:predicted anti-sigma-YlaC factor YlaD
MKEDTEGLMPTCREVHRLVSEGQDRDLSIMERVWMKVHLMMCGACTNFNQQMALLRKAMRKMEVPVEEVVRDGKDRK